MAINRRGVGETSEKFGDNWWDYPLLAIEGVANIFGRSVFSPEEQESEVVRKTQQWHPISGLWGGMESTFSTLGAVASAPGRYRKDWTTALKPWEYLPGGEEYKSYEKIPWWQQMIYESPAMLFTGGVGAAKAMPKAGQLLTPAKGMFGLKAPPPQAFKASKITNPSLQKLKTIMEAHTIARGKTKAVRTQAMKEMVAKAEQTLAKELARTGDPGQAMAMASKMLSGKRPIVLPNLKFSGNVWKKMSSSQRLSLAKQAGLANPEEIAKVNWNALTNRNQGKLLSGFENWFKSEVGEAASGLDVGKIGASLTTNEVKELKGLVLKTEGLQFFEKKNSLTALDKLLFEDQLLQPAELKLLEGVFPGISELNTLKATMGPKAWRTFVDVANIPRSVLASTDLSFTLRQGIMLLTRFPNLLIPTIKWQLKTLFSSKNWEYLDEMIRTDPDFHIFDSVMKTYFAPESGAGIRIGQRTEEFMSSLAEKIPGIGKVVQASERSFTAGGNYLRWQASKNYLAIARSAGMENPENLRGLGRLINALSGRGELPKAFSGEMGGFVNAILFAPKFVWSRIQAPLIMLNPGTPALVRKEAARALVQFLGAGATIVGLAKLFGAEVEMNPLSSDFGKIKIGNTRLDIWAGYVQWARFLSQLTTGKSKVVATGEIVERNRLDTFMNLVQSKESPMASIFTDLLKGENFLGEPILTWEDIRSRITPLFIQDLWDAIEADGLMGAAAAGLPGALGVGVVSYEPRKSGASSGLPKLPEMPGLELPSLK
jgi:hypothetical protein